MSRTLLVLAASTYQLPVIRTAQRLGWRVITTDNNPRNPGHSISDVSYTVDTTDRDGVLSIARTERISGVISPGTDIAVTTAAYVAEELGLAGPPLWSASILTNKLAFRSFLKENGLPTPSVKRVSEMDLDLCLSTVDERWVMKPSMSSGSKGVFFVESSADIRAHYQSSRRYSWNGEVFLEEYIAGTQHSCEGFLSDGKVAFCLITDRDTVDFPYATTAGHRVPTAASMKAQTNIKIMLERLFAMVEICDGPFDCDFVVNGDEVTIIEVTPRLGGNAISSLVHEACELDLVGAAIRYATGESIGRLGPTTPTPAAVLILGVDRSGRLQLDMDSFHALKAQPWVRTLELDYPEGSLVEAFTNGRNRVGEAMIVGSSRSDLDRKVDVIRAKLALAAQ